MGRSLTAAEVDLYDHIPRDVAVRTRLHRVRRLASGAHGMTLGHHVLLVRGHEDSPDLLAHELVHVRQYAETGTVRFLLRYVRDYAGNRRRLPKHREAYLAIPTEVEARDEATRWKAGHPGARS